MIRQKHNPSVCVKNCAQWANFYDEFCEVCKEQIDREMDDYAREVYETQERDHELGRSEEIR